MKKQKSSNIPSLSKITKELEQHKTEMKKQKSLSIKQSYIKKSKQPIVATSSKPINRLDLTIVRWGQDGWILDYFNEHIFKGLMRDFHKEEDGILNISPSVLFEFYIEGVKDNLLPAPIVNIDLKKAKQFTQRLLSEKQLSRTIKKVGDFLFEGDITLPEIKNIDSGETFQSRLPQKRQPIFSYREKEMKKARGKKTVKHYSYDLLLTFLGIYLMLTACAFYNVDFLPKALYRLDDGCNDFFRSIVGLRSQGRVKFSYLKVRDRMGIRPHKNSSVERQHVEIKLNHLKNNQIIEDWKIVKGGKRYGRNEDIVYEITLSERNWKRRVNLAKRKAREKMLEEEMRKQGKLLTEKDNEN